MRYAMCLLAVVVSVSTSSGQGWVDIPKEMRIRNQRGNCVWAAAEPVFVEAGYTQLQGLFKDAMLKGWHGSSHLDVAAVLDREGIPYLMSKGGRFDYSLFDEACARKVAFYFQIRGHALIGLGLERGVGAWVLDNNPPLEPQWWDWPKFVTQWDGNAICPAERRSPQRPLPEGRGAKPADLNPKVILPVSVPASPLPELGTVPVEINLTALRDVMDKFNRVMEKLDAKIDKFDLTSILNYGQALFGAILGAFGVNVYHTKQARLAAAGGTKSP